MSSTNDASSNVLQFVDLTKDIMERVIEVFCKMNQSKKLHSTEENNQEIKDGKRIYVNFHKILKKRLFTKTPDTSIKLIAPITLSASNT